MLNYIVTCTIHLFVHIIALFQHLILIIDLQIFRYARWICAVPFCMVKIKFWTCISLCRQSPIKTGHFIFFSRDIKKLGLTNMFAVHIPSESAELISYWNIELLNILKAHYD